ncbi:RNA 2'-phosphotransferase [Spirulina sp. CS-785/01]|uniref:RNA 2'-phosphotransferase n=1 Tax=Spirulina sp. CS-785/01 TaxID=3021716 RepID=UPI003FA6B693
MSVKRRTKISKYLSYHLRHHPEKLGLTLDQGGWVDVENLLQATQKHHFPLTRQELTQVVAENEKQRFSFDQTGQRIRANQGHSIPIDLQLTPTQPPDILYHGTSQKFVPKILQQGLRKMSRHHVHLSSDQITAKKVGQRHSKQRHGKQRHGKQLHGKPAIFQINATQLYHDGFPFYCTENQVWLVDHVPPPYLTLLS